MRIICLLPIILFLLPTMALAQEANRESVAETVVKLDGPDAAKQWKFTEKNGSIQNGELVFNSMNGIAKGFYLPSEWNDVKLSAKFMVEPGPGDKVLACGFIVRAVDALHYYYVHFDRHSAILVRFNESDEWMEIKRVAVPNREAGKWYDASLEINDDTLTVSFDGQKLYDVRDDALKGAGRIGFYGSQGIAHVKNIRIEGNATAATSELKIPAPFFIRISAPASVGGYAAFPDVCRLQDGRLLCVFYAGYGHVSFPNDALPKGGQIVACYSSDEGNTWTFPETIIDTPLDDRDASVVQLPDGRILCTFFTYRHEKKDDWSSATTETGIVESTDNGKTWSEPRFLFKDFPANVAVSQPIRVLSDGTLLLPIYTFKKSELSSGAVSLSYDKGKTWSDVITIPNGGKQLDAETDVIELKDGTLYAIQRDWMGVSYSKDKGKTWSVSEHIGFAGHCPYLLRTKGDVILLGTRLPKTNLRISRDECKTWSEAIMVDSVIGAYPSMVELKDGSILIVYYEEGSGSCIRVKKFRVTDTAVEWQRFE